MDWARAKTILILLFMVGNILLGYQLWINTRGVDGVAYVMGQDPEAPLLDDLADFGLNSEAEIPEDTPRLYRLRLTPAEVDLDSLRAALFGAASGEEIIIGGEVGGYRSGEVLLIRGGPGAIRYRSGSTAPGEEMDTEKAESIAEEFLSHPALRPTGMEYDYSLPISNGAMVQINYRQEHRDLPLFGGGVILRVGEDGIAEYQRLWFDVRGNVGTPTQVLSASAAISANLPRLAQLVPEGTLVEVALGYYAGMSDAPEWEVDPAWRLRFKDGTVVIVNAYTGAVEWPL